MKKTYIQPACEMTHVETQQMIAESITPNQLGGKGGNEIGDDVDASRFGPSSWGDDEE